MVNMKNIVRTVTVCFAEGVIAIMTGHNIGVCFTEIAKTVGEELYEYLEKRFSSKKDYEYHWNGINCNRTEEPLTADDIILELNKEDYHNESLEFFGNTWMFDGSLENDYVTIDSDELDCCYIIPVRR